MLSLTLDIMGTSPEWVDGFACISRLCFH